MVTARQDIIRKQRAVPSAGGTPLKIVITGPFSAGKTTLIKTISEIAIVGTERDVSDDMRSVKTSTTVAMDFGRITFGPDATLFLFGTPGQRRFEVMWEILSEGMIGFILLVHAGSRESIEEAAHILETFRSYADVPHVVGVSHLDEVDEPIEQVCGRVREALGLTEGEAVLPCDPRDREDIKSLLLDILLGVLRRLERVPVGSA